MAIDVAGIAAQVETGIVGVSTAGHRHRQGRQGTGVVIADGRVLTTAHNVRGDASPTVIFSDGRRVVGSVAGTSSDLDLAVITVDTAGSTPLSPPEDPQIQLGQDVVAVGAADGVVRITAGVVATTSARFRTASGSPVAGVIEHTAPLPSGSSGGPVLDADGAFIAMDANRVGRGFYQAVPVDAAFRSIVDLLADGQSPPKRRLGIAVVDGGRAAHVREAAGLAPIPGVLVTGVDEDGPAKTAGLDRGDVISAVDDQRVGSAEDLLLALRRASASAGLTVTRGAESSRHVVVTFSEGPTQG